MLEASEYTQKGKQEGLSSLAGSGKASQKRWDVELSISGLGRPVVLNAFNLDFIYLFFSSMHFKEIGVLGSRPRAVICRAEVRSS